MAELIRMPRAAWRRQPQGAVEIDWKNPHTKNLIVASVPFDKRNIVNNQPPIIDQGLSASVSIENQWLSSSGGLGWEVMNGSSEYSLLTRFMPDPSYGDRIGAFVSDSYSIYFYLDSNSEIKVYEFIGSWPLLINTGVALSSGNIHQLALSIGSTNVTCNIDGNQSFTNTKSFPTSSTSGAGYIYRQYSTYYAHTLKNGMVFLAWNAALSNESYKDLYDNVYQVFDNKSSRFILIPDGAGGGSFSSTSLLDALIQKTFSSTTTLDALIQSAFNSSISLDSLISAVKNNTITFDALLQSTKNSTISVDALVQSVKAGSVSIDVLIQLTLSRITSIDALIQATKSGTLSLDAIITGSTGTFANLSIDALIQAVKNQTISVDALIRKEYASTIALDAYVALVGTRAISLDALIQLTMTGSISIDVLIQMSKNNFVSFDALIQSAKSGMISLDAILTLATNVSVFLDAYVQKTLSRGVSLDAIIGAIADMIMPVGRVISVNQSSRLVSISNSERMISIQ